MLDHTPVPAAVPQPNGLIGNLLQKVAWPLLLFSAVLASALYLSRVALLPKLTQVSVAGGLHSATELRGLQADLTSQVAVAEEQRGALVRPMEDALYEAAKAERSSLSDLTGLRSDILRIAHSFDVDGKPVVFFQEFHLDATTHGVALKGDIRNVGPQSMTVLAAFRDELSKLPHATGLSPTNFTRIDDPAIGPHSPFDLTFTIQ